MLDSSTGTSRQPRTAQALVEHDGFEEVDRLLGQGQIGGQETQADPVRAARREVEVDHRAQELVGHLDEDAGAVATIRLGSLGAAVVEVAQRAERRRDDVMAGPTFDVDDERDAARVVFEPRIVQAARLGQAAKRQPRSVYAFVCLRHLAPTLSRFPWAQRDNVGPAAKR